MATLHTRFYDQSEGKVCWDTSVTTISKLGEFVDSSPTNWCNKWAEWRTKKKKWNKWRNAWEACHSVAQLSRRIFLLSVCLRSPEHGLLGLWEGPHCLPYLHCLNPVCPPTHPPQKKCDKIQISKEQMLEMKWNLIVLAWIQPNFLHIKSGASFSKASSWSQTFFPQKKQIILLPSKTGRVSPDCW